MHSPYPKKLSVIIPVYNESDRIIKGLNVTKGWQRKFPEWEFIVVNDGSTDDTVGKINKFKFIKLVSYLKNQGKGFALKQGITKTTKASVLLSDIDFSTPLTELPKLFRELTKADIVIGSRKTPGSRILQHQSWWREWLGRQFTNLGRLWLNLNISDFTCGFKLMKIGPAKRLFALSKIKRWGYDAEILFLAKKFKYIIKEVPVIWQNDPKTKVNLLLDAARSFWDLILIRFYHG